MKIRPVGGSELFSVDGQTGMSKLLDAYQNFAKVSTKEGDKEKFSL
jgi:hypothetical protein